MKKPTAAEWSTAWKIVNLWQINYEVDTLKSYSGENLSFSHVVSNAIKALPEVDWAWQLRSLPKLADCTSYKDAQDIISDLRGDSLSAVTEDEQHEFRMIVVKVIMGVIDVLDKGLTWRGEAGVSVMVDEQVNTFRVYRLNPTRGEHQELQTLSM